MIIPPEFLSHMYDQFNGKRMPVDKVTRSRFVDLFNKIVDDRLKHLNPCKDVFGQKLVDPKLAPNYNLTQIAQKVTGKRHGDMPAPIGPVYTTTFDTKELP